MSGAAPATDTRALAAALRGAIDEEFGVAARPLDAVLVELGERAADIDAAGRDEQMRELLRLEPLLDDIEDLLDVLRVGG